MTKDIRSYQIRDFCTQHIEQTVDEFAADVLGPLLLYKFQDQVPQVLDLGALKEMGLLPLIMGRGGRCDLQFRDSAISRVHAFIEFKEEKWRLFDVGSNNGIVCNGERISPYIPMEMTERQRYFLASIVRFEFWNSKDFYNTLLENYKKQAKTSEITRRLRRLSRSGIEAPQLLPSSKKNPRYRGPRSMATIVGIMRKHSVESFVQRYPNPFLVTFSKVNDNDDGFQDETAVRALEGTRTGTLSQKLHYWNLERSTGQTVIKVGRDMYAGVCVTAKTVSRKHAEFVFQGNKWYVRDLGSKHGTFVNGKQINTGTQLEDETMLRFGGEAVMTFLSPQILFERFG